jgi:hypothetical protein
MIPGVEEGSQFKLKMWKYDEMMNEMDNKHCVVCIYKLLVHLLFLVL